MPGAPNKPPESPPAPPPAPTSLESPAQHVLRRLAPSRIALRLPIWKGNPSPELAQPFTEAERLYAAGDAAGADGCLDRLAIRFAEPRWPSLPEPFRQLRVPIPAPQPPHWDPEHGLATAEKEARRLKRYAELQLALARASLEFESQQGTPVDDLRAHLKEAEAHAARQELDRSFWGPMDELWEALRARVPMPRTPPRSPPPPPAPEAEGAGA
jgi:hypothetical protein